MSEIPIRLAEPRDAATIGRIYDEGIDSRIATFAAGDHPADERRRWLAGRPESAPVYCATDGGDDVLGWSALAPFSHREWYAGVAEYTVYVSAGQQGRGVGSALLSHLIGVAPEFGYWKLVGMILPENGPGLALARRHGFRVVGTHMGHGRIAHQWRDVTLVERHLEVSPW
ncbi:MAG: N-acetyltransferase [Actinobacteria bacterium]|nr:N-acetyltransferase [Actinomycetota bacterium]